MNAALLKARLASLIAAYGETVSYTGPGSRGTITFAALIEVAPTQNLQQLAGVALGSSSSSGVTVTSTGVAEVYPTIALFMDPAAGGGPPTSSQLPQVGEQFTRDGILLTVKELYTSRLADSDLVLVAIAQH